MCNFLNIFCFLRIIFKYYKKDIQTLNIYVINEFIWKY